MQDCQRNEVLTLRQRANMDIPLATNDIGIQYGFKGYRRKSSTFCTTTGVDGLSALSTIVINNL